MFKDTPMDDKDREEFRVRYINRHTGEAVLSLPLATMVMEYAKRACKTSGAPDPEDMHIEIGTPNGDHTIFPEFWEID